MHSFVRRLHCSKQSSYLGVLGFMLLALFLSGCSGLEAEIQQQAQRSANQIRALETALDLGQVRNAVLITQYADLLSAEKPKLNPLLSTLRQDAASQGPLFQNLQNRLDTAVNNPAAFASDEERLAELVALYEAADVNAYNDMLSDPLNVIADLSEGSLPRVNAISQAQSLAANGAEDFGAGSQLVGNPNYGQWQTDSRGFSFWEWYGMYALFSNLASPVRYDSWARSRDYSYYQDYGRNQYSSKRQRANETQAFERTRKQFGSQRFDSAYSKSRTGASAVSSQSRSNQVRQQTATASRFKSNLSKSTSSKPKTTSGASSFRNSSSKTSRGVRRGK